MIISIGEKQFEVSELYQPLYGLDPLNPKRYCIDRWNSILQAEEGYNDSEMFKSSIVDWGCSLGWFSFKLAEKCLQDIYAIDWDINNIKVCKELQLRDGNKNNIKFMHGSVPKDVPDKIRSHLILSVLHHAQQSVFIPEDILYKIKDAKTIYIELAHCNEYPFWSTNLCPQEYFLSPFHYLMRVLEKQFPNYSVRLIGVHNTHIGSVRPLYQLKLRLNEPIGHHVIYDRFKLPYIDFGDFSLNKEGILLHGKRIKDNVDYAYAMRGDEKFFIKFKNKEVVKVVNYVDGFLLNDIIKFGLLPYYDRLKIKKQLVTYSFEKHKDPHPWNFIINENSEVIPIDYDEGVSSFKEDYINIYIQSLLQTI